MHTGATVTAVCHIINIPTLTYRQSPSIYTHARAPAYLWPQTYCKINDLGCICFFRSFACFGNFSTETFLVFQKLRNCLCYLRSGKVYNMRTTFRLLQVAAYTFVCRCSLADFSLSFPISSCRLAFFFMIKRINRNLLQLLYVLHA